MVFVAVHVQSNLHFLPQYLLHRHLGTSLPLTLPAFPPIPPSPPSLTTVFTLRSLRPSPPNHRPPLSSLSLLGTRPTISPAILPSYLPSLSHSHSLTFPPSFSTSLTHLLTHPLPFYSLPLSPSLPLTHSPKA